MRNFAKPAGWVDNVLGMAVSENRAMEQDLQRPTDWQKLDRAFSELSAEKIICVHSPAEDLAGCIVHVRDKWNFHGAERSNWLGYCLYSRQDVRNAIADEELTVDFGLIPVAPVVAETGVMVDDIAVSIITALGNYGLKVKNKAPGRNRLTISPFNWRKDSPFIILDNSLSATH